MTFEQYIAKYHKNYEAKDYQIRKSLFEERLTQIQLHNAQPKKSHFKDVNNLTDWTDSEMRSLLGFDKNLAMHRRVERHGINFFRTLAKSPKQATSLPASVDWTLTGALTPVKNQGGCGSCWAFAGTEAIESNVFIETGRLFTLAPQQYVDCVTNSDDCGGSGGCEGATPDLLFEYATKNGAYNETQYPYQGQDNTCKNLTSPVAIIGGWADVSSNDPVALQQAVVNGPVTVGVAAASWGAYGGGVLQFEDCDADIDHAVLLVGYGTDPEQGDYWKIQNSWGPGWGENGFIRLARHADDNKRCKEDAKPSDGFGCKNGPKEVKVCGTCGILYLPSYPFGGRVINQ